MAKRLKANIGYQPIVEEVSRKFVPRKETCSQRSHFGPVTIDASGWMGGAVRKSNRAGLGACTRNYLVIRANARQMEPTGDEVAAREMFADAIKGRNHIIRDLGQITSVQTLWMTAKDIRSKLINGVSAEGYTFYGWIMAVQYQGLKNAAEAGKTYDANTFPTKFDN